MTKVRPHQELLNDGVLKIFDSAHGRAMFVSHQWTTETHPDPEARQLKVFQQAMSNLLSGRTVPEPNVWAEIMCQVAGGRQSFKACEWTATPLLIWYDYFCIPQYPVTGPRSRSLSENNMDDQRSAIASIPAYIDKCDFFVALCPLMKHGTTLSTLDTRSWDQRGWCRAEAVVRDLSVKHGLNLIVESPQQVSLAVTHSMLKAPGEGKFTVPGDRKVVGELVKEVLHQQLHSALRTGDFPLYRFLLNHQSALLRNSDTMPVPGLLQVSPEDCGGSLQDVPPEPSEIAEAFLSQNCFEKISDRDKLGWSPLLYAALGGRPEVVEALLLQHADPNDFIRKFQNIVMFMKGTPALSICVVQKHNQAMKALLRFQADPNKQDPTGASPLFYVASSDNVEGARILLEAGADLSLTGIFNTNAFDIACLMGASQVLEEVFIRPPHAACRREALGLSMGAGHGNPETVAILLRMGCDKDSAISPRNTLGRFFDRAMKLKHRVAPTSLTALIYHGSGATPLMRSILSGSFSCSLLLLESKARVDLRNSKQQTAFDLAVKKHAPEMLLWQLWKRGAGDYASKASISWWSSNAPERFPSVFGQFDSPSSSGVAMASTTLSVTDNDLEQDPMMSIYF
eukprot:Skav230054  [mRNA]  locus=scaffold1221:62503:64380:+ [translate_table: standard]